MKSKITLCSVFVFAVLAITYTKVHALECYYCEGEECNETVDTQLGYCGPNTFTTTTTEQSSSSEPTAAATSDPTTTQPETTTDSAETTADNTVETTAEPPAEPPTEPPAEPPAELPAESPAMPADAVAVNVPDVLAQSPLEVSDPATALAQAPVEAAAQAPVEAAPPAPALDIAPAARKGHVANAADLLLRNYRAISRSRRDTPDSYACYSVDVVDDGNAITKRGCVQIPSDLNGCDALRQQLGLTEDGTANCNVCVNDGCNSGSSALQISVTLLLTLLLGKCLL